MRPDDGTVKRHPAYERVAARLTEQLGDTALSMADDQDAHLVAFIAVSEMLGWLMDALDEEFGGF